MRNGALLTIAVLVITIIASGCVSPTIGSNNFKYSVGNCGPAGFSKEAEVPFYTYRNGHLLIHLNLRYACCAKLSLKERTRKNEILIYIDNAGEMCRCMCSYPIDINMTADKGIYVIKIFGVKYRDVQNYSLIYNFTVDTSTPRECATDEDCVHYPSCCHIKSQRCIPIFLKKDRNCTNVMCTEECRQCNACFCENGTCVSKKVSGCC